MKNTKLYGLLAIILLLAVSITIAAPSPPYTFNGRYNVYDEPCDNCEIQFRYLDSQEDKDWKSTVTNKYGDYQFTNKEFKDGDWYRPGDRVEVKFCNDNIQSSCLQTLRFEGEAGTWTNIQIEKDNDYEVLVNKGKTIVIVTKDGSVVIDGPEIIKMCDDGSEPIDGNCPTDIWTDIFYVAIGILATFGFGVGFMKGLALYYWKKGTNQIKEGKTYNSPDLIAEGKKNRSRALKMTVTCLKNVVLGKYDKLKRG